MGVCNCSMLWCTLVYVHSSLAIILIRKRELVALLGLSSWCLVMVVWLLLAAPWVYLRFVIVVFPDHTHYFLKIIENIWDELNRCVRRTWAIPTTLNQLRAKIFYEWNNFPQNYVQRYVTSMRRRCLAVVNSAGGHTRY